MKKIYKYERRNRHLAALFLKIMKDNPDYTGEKAFEKTLGHYGIVVQKDEFAKLFHEFQECYACIMYYYREKIIFTLLQAGIELHVYSETWKTAPFGNHKGLVCHPALDVVSCFKVMQQSKISLNIMSGHKDGLTERILNAMLCKSVVMSDRSTALEEQFTNGEDLILFSLRQLEELPLMVRDLLSDEERQERIAQNGFRVASENHLWINRVRQLFTDVM